MTSISRSAEFNRYRPVSQSRAEPGAERNQAYREVQRDFRADNNPARQADIDAAVAKQKRGETLNPHEQGLIDGQRRTTSTTQTNSPGQTATQKTLETSGFELDHEITSRMVARGARIVEVPIRYAPRTKAEGKKIGLKDWFIGFRTFWRYRRG